MIQEGRVLPLYGPLLNGRGPEPDVLDRGPALSIDELAARLLQELGDDARILHGVARVVARAHQLRCAGVDSELLGRATATSGDDDLPAPAVGWWSMCAGSLGGGVEDHEELRATG
ncbi:MAG TPA: hypothetical protein VH134_00310 [Candidatus Dormibacteraeota bacterium]|jgi:hypothetical protein|nr:hypothetical protein [Candidatus Dormibacteraeota bacterium]